MKKRVCVFFAICMLMINSTVFAESWKDVSFTDAFKLYLDTDDIYYDNTADLLVFKIKMEFNDEFKADLAKNFTDKEKKLIDEIAYQVKEECFDPYERSIYTRQYTFNDINGNILHINNTPSEKRIITATEKDIVDIIIINQVMYYYKLKN